MALSLALYGYLMNAQLFPKNPHGTNITPVARYAHSLLARKKALGQNPTFSRKEKSAITAELKKIESAYVHKDVNISRIQVDSILRDKDVGKLIEFETLGPYLSDYIGAGGMMTLDNLTSEDAIGLQLAVTLRRIFKNARLVSLYDEYNGRKLNESGESQTADFTEQAKINFKRSLVSLFVSHGVISPRAVEGQDYILLAESARVRDAEKLVARLEAEGYIEREGDQIAFVNDAAENPLHRRVSLRTKNGKWLCEALDAACFLQPVNLEITHIVVLPDYMKDQQDKTWEILRTLGIQPENYHNIFFDPTQSVEEIVRVVEDIFQSAQPALTTVAD